MTDATKLMEVVEQLRHTQTTVSEILSFAVEKADGYPVQSLVAAASRYTDDIFDIYLLLESIAKDQAEAQKGGA